MFNSVIQLMDLCLNAVCVRSLRHKVVYLCLCLICKGIKQFLWDSKVVSVMKMSQMSFYSDCHT